MSTLADERPPLSIASKIIRLAAIGVGLAAFAGAFAYAGGWLSPHRLTPTKFANAFEAIEGKHEGFRRNHAKGLCVSGTFESNGAGERLSKAAVFQSGARAPVVGRFSLAGGMPSVADSAASIRGLGLQFSPTGAQPWRTAMINLPVFPVRTPEAFYDRLVASAPDASTGKPDPAKMIAFNAAHPESVAAINIIKAQPPAAGFAETTFHGLNAFRFIDRAGTSTPVRWQLEPESVATTPTTAPSASSSPSTPNFLFDAVINRIAVAPLRWHLILVVGQPGDPTSDATQPWPTGRERVDVGTLILDHVEAEADTATADLNFDPLVLPDGIAPSDDPLLSARSAVYAASVKRRAGEAGEKSPSAITHDEVLKGGTH